MSLFSKGRSSHLNLDVLNEKDSNEDIISTWCKPGFKPEEAICFVCNKTINCSQHGVSAVKRHAKSKGHVDNCLKIRDGNGVLKTTGHQQSISASFGLTSDTQADKLTKAEILFCTAIASHNVPYTFANTATQLFPRMFSDSKVAKDFKCSSSKVSYFISDGLGPFFKEQLISDINKTQCFYSVQIDETPIPDKRVQQLDILVRYFSEKNERVVVRHWETCHIGSATADIVVSKVQESLESLPKEKFLSVFSDGPNVMKSFKKKMKDIHPDLLDIGECVLHKVHNSFSKGLSAFGHDVESLVTNIYYFFKISAVQSERVKNLQVQLGMPEHVFVRHVSSRWLTLETSVTRVIEQFAVLKAFFEKHSHQSQRLDDLRKAFGDKTLLAQLLFVQNVSKIFTRFLKLYQVEAPMIHTLHYEMENLVKTLMGRFLQEEFFRNKQVTEIKVSDVEKGDNWCRVDMGVDTDKVLVTFTEKEQKVLRMSARSFYIAVVTYLLKKLPLGNKVLKNIVCLHPANRLKEESVHMLKYMAAELPNILNVADISSTTDEFIRLQGEEESALLYTPESKSDFSEESSDDDDSKETEISLQHMINERIDEYWAKVFKIKDISGNYKYSNLAKLVKALLSLPHGNADVERGFSVNRQLLDKRAPMSLESINAIRKIKCHLKTNCNNKVTNLEITPGLLKVVRLSRKKKLERLEQKKALKRANENILQEEENKKSLQEMEKELSEKLKLLRRCWKMLKKLFLKG